MCCLWAPEANSCLTWDWSAICCRYLSTMQLKCIHKTRLWTKCYLFAPNRDAIFVPCLTTSVSNSVEHVSPDVFDIHLVVCLMECRIQAPIQRHSFSCSISSRRFTDAVATTFLAAQPVMQLALALLMCRCELPRWQGLVAWPAHNIIFVSTFLGDDGVICQSLTDFITVS